MKDLDLEEIMFFLADAGITMTSTVCTYDLLYLTGVGHICDNVSYSQDYLSVYLSTYSFIHSFIYNKYIHSFL